MSLRIDGSASLCLVHFLQGTVLANYSLLTIPPHLWYGIRSLAPSVTIVANCPDLATEPHEFDRKLVDSPDTPCRLPTIG